MYALLLLKEAMRTQYWRRRKGLVGEEKKKLCHMGRKLPAATILKYLCMCPCESLRGAMSDPVTTVIQKCIRSAQDSAPIGPTFSDAIQRDGKSKSLELLIYTRHYLCELKAIKRYCCSVFQETGLLA